MLLAIVIEEAFTALNCEQFAETDPTPIELAVQGLRSPTFAKAVTALEEVTEMLCIKLTIPKADTDAGEVAETDNSILAVPLTTETTLELPVEFAKRLTEAEEVEVPTLEPETEDKEDPSAADVDVPDELNITVAIRLALPAAKQLTPEEAFTEAVLVVLAVAIDVAEDNPVTAESNKPLAVAKEIADVEPVRPSIIEALPPAIQPTLEDALTEAVTVLSAEAIELTDEDPVATATDTPAAEAIDVTAPEAVVVVIDPAEPEAIQITLEDALTEFVTTVFAAAVEVTEEDPLAVA